MTKLAIIATIKIVSGERDVYLTALNAHAVRCKATEPGTLKFDILVPHEDSQTVMLHELYASEASFKAHMEGDSMKQMRSDTAAIKTTLSGIPCQILE